MANKTKPLFRVGQRVRFTDAAYDAGIVTRGTKRPTTGVVVAYLGGLGVKVRKDGQKTASHYHVAFWEPIRGWRRG